MLYVERLIAPDVVNTMPESVLRAFADHGRVGRPLGVDTGDAERILRRAAAAGVDLEAIAGDLEREGVDAFRDSYREVLERIAGKARSVRVTARAARRAATGIAPARAGAALISGSSA